MMKRYRGYHTQAPGGADAWAMLVNETRALVCRVGPHVGWIVRSPSGLQRSGVTQSVSEAKAHARGHACQLAVFEATRRWSA